MCSTKQPNVGATKKPASGHTGGAMGFEGRIVERRRCSRAIVQHTLPVVSRGRRARGRTAVCASPGAPAAFVGAHSTVGPRGVVPEVAHRLG
jgi:hypothetical protein